MQTWNDRLSKALDSSGVSAHSLAMRIGVPSPTVYAWIGAGHIRRVKRIGAEHLFAACRELKLRPEWVLFGEGSPNQETIAWPFVFTLEQYLSLDAKDRYEIENLIHAKIVHAMGTR